eukprot:CAMPEP_0184689444 /NCGR_PEP_ID=MMETSP0312-20130426/30658_1 /TAXON_ID=31354 /ORGANISM="Compsopogon coeruleus, Strain SAG 36.94" /LENGTH=464 /DNA_ID=CAMNT_0027146789 /DNA_START=623 /DNA_END=2017 /DNA_ORIENTATION=-
MEVLLGTSEDVAAEEAGGGPPRRHSGVTIRHGPFENPGDSGAPSHGPEDDDGPSLHQSTSNVRDLIWTILSGMKVRELRELCVAKGYTQRGIQKEVALRVFANVENEVRAQNHDLDGDGYSIEKWIAVLPQIDPEIRRYLSDPIATAKPWLEAPQALKQQPPLFSLPLREFLRLAILITEDDECRMALLGERDTGQPAKWIELVELKFNATTFCPPIHPQFSELDCRFPPMEFRSGIDLQRALEEMQEPFSFFFRRWSKKGGADPRKIYSMTDMDPTGRVTNIGMRQAILCDVFKCGTPVEHTDLVVYMSRMWQKEFDGEETGPDHHPSENQAKFPPLKRRRRSKKVSEGLGQCAEDEGWSDRPEIPKSSIQLAFSRGTGNLLLDTTKVLANAIKETAKSPVESESCSHEEVKLATARMELLLKTLETVRLLSELGYSPNHPVVKRVEQKVEEYSQSLSTVRRL